MRNLDVLVMDRRMGKTERMIQEILKEQEENPTGKIVIIVPAVNYRDWLVRRLLDEGVHMGFVEMMSSRSARDRLRGMNASVYVEDVDIWPLGIYDPIFDYPFDFKLVTASPIGPGWQWF